MADKRRNIWYRSWPVGKPDVTGNQPSEVDLVVYGGSNALFAAEYRSSFEGQFSLLIKSERLVVVSPGTRSCPWGPESRRHARRGAGLQER